MVVYDWGIHFKANEKRPQYVNLLRPLIFIDYGNYSILSNQFSHIHFLMNNAL